MSLPTNHQSTTLPEDRQDANMAGTYEARPGVENTAPAGLSTLQGDSRQSASTQSLSESVKSSLDKMSSDSTSNTQSVTSQLPSAQGALGAVQQGASSLLAGISSLAIGATKPIADNAKATHPESANARDVDEFHVPGAFESETFDQEDKQAVKEGVQSAYTTLPSTAAVKESLPEGVRNTAQSAYDSIPSTKDVKQQLPGVQSSDRTLQNEQIHKDGTDYIKGQLYGQGHTSGNTMQMPSNSMPIPPLVAESQKKAGGAAPLDRSISSINSVGAGSSTAQLAGQVPLEARGVPQVVADSQKKADVGPEASANREAVQEKKLMEQELQQVVPEEPATSSTTSGTAGNSGIYGAIVGGLATAGAAAAGVATYARQKTHETTGTDPVSVLPAVAQRSIDGDTASTRQTELAQPGAVPQIVTDSQRQAGFSPEAAANPEAVQEKRQVEQELRKEVQPEQAGSSDQGLTGRIAPALSNIGATAGTAAAGAAAYARQTTHQVTGVDPVSALPESAQRSIDGNSASSRAGASNVADAGLTGNTTSTSHSQTHPAMRSEESDVMPRPVNGNSSGSGIGHQTMTVPQGGLQFLGSSDDTTSTGISSSPSAADSTNPSSGTFLNYDSSRGTTAPHVGEGHHHGVDLHSGVKNGVTGLNADNGLGVPQGGLQFPYGRGGNSGVEGSGASPPNVLDGPPVHLSSVAHPDLSAGVKNGVVGAGARGPEGL